jgi:hypothetical protein
MSEKQHIEEISGFRIIMLNLAGYTEEEYRSSSLLDADISDVIKKFDGKRGRLLTMEINIKRSSSRK